ncbi:MAG: LysM domain-containing protein [Caldilineales bacterium]
MFTKPITRSVRLLLCTLALLLALLPATVAAAPAEAAVAAGEGCSSFHTVTRGQTLWSIARWYGVSVETLQRVNRILDPNRIYAGQLLCIPIGAGGGTTHVIQRGETLSSIARLYGTTWQCLAHRNHIPNPNHIRAGQLLIIAYC